MHSFATSFHSFAVATLLQCLLSLGSHSAGLWYTALIRTSISTIFTLNTLQIRIMFLYKLFFTAVLNTSSVPRVSKTEKKEMGKEQNPPLLRGLSKSASISSAQALFQCISFSGGFRRPSFRSLRLLALKPFCNLLYLGGTWIAISAASYLLVQHSQGKFRLLLWFWWFFFCLSTVEETKRGICWIFEYDT